MNPSANATSDAVSESGFAVILEELASKCLAGEHIDWSAYKRDYPEHVEELRQLLPAMRAVADLSRSVRDGHGASTPGDAVTGTLGDFRILQEIGRGGMGVVYEAEQISLGRRVALKVLPFASTLDAKQLQRFKNEAQAAASLHHTNIVPVHATGCERGVHYYAMQFIEGQSLAEVIADLRLQNADLRKKRGAGTEPNSVAQAEAKSVAGAEVLRSPGAPTVDSPANAGASEYLSTGHPASNLKSTIWNLKSSTFPSTQGRAFYHTVARLGIQAAEALDYSHELGVIHRDIKPANMLVDGRGILWITDFGLAHCQSQAGLTMSGDLVGTLRYMSPEQALAKRVVVDHRTDIYSLGATLYELLTGEPVFGGGDRQELLRQIAFEEPKTLRCHNKAIPAELETIVLKALEKNPADRYATAKELAEDLERFVRDEPIRARRPSVARRLRGWCRRHKVLGAAMATLAFTVLFLGTGALVWQQRQRSAAELAILKDLEEADHWQSLEQWSKALQVLERAGGHLQAYELPGLKASVQDRRRELLLVAQLQEIPLQIPLQAFQALPIHEGSLDIADRAYADAFAALGIDIAALPAQEVARRIRACSIQTQLVTALDYWAQIRDRSATAGQSLRVIAQLADDDPWRRRLREPQVIKDRVALERIASDERILTQPPNNLLILAGALEALQAEKAALTLVRMAQQRYPGDFWLNFKLARLLDSVGLDTVDTLGYARAALALQPTNPFTYHFLGSVLEDEKNRLPEAVAAYRKAIELKPDFFMAKWRLLLAQAKENLPTDYPRLPWKIAALRRVLELHPGVPDLHHYLGTELYAHQNLVEAEAEYRKAIALHPRCSGAYHNLANVLFLQHKVPQAVAASRQAIALQPYYPNAYNSLSVFLDAQQQQEQAAEARNKAEQLDAGWALANQAWLLMGQGQFKQALVYFTRAQKHFPRYLGELDWATRWDQLDGKLSKILKGQALPASTAERFSLAELCQLPCRKFYATAARLYGEAFAADPKLTADLRTGIRYSAACAAAQAGCARGEDAAGLDADTRARLRQQALDWLSADLAGWRAELVKEPVTASIGARYEMQKWQQDAALTEVRAEDALANLPEAERGQWHALWQEVGELKRRTRSNE